MDFIVSIYNVLDEDSPYRSDIFDLFGTVDGMEVGAVGSKKGDEFKRLEWDWPETGIIKVCKFYFWFQNNTLEGFNRWYHAARRKGFRDLTLFLNRVLYVFRYKGRRISAFVARVNNIDRRDKKLWFEFTPVKFVLLPPDFLAEYRRDFFSRGRENREKWVSYLSNFFTETEAAKGAEAVCSSASTRDVYHIIPSAYLNSWIDRQSISEEKTKPVFVATIEDNKKLLAKNLHTNNQIFWSVFYQYIGRSQVKGGFSIVERGNSYNVTDIPVNSLTERGFVYNHEVGTAYVVFRALSDVFRDLRLNSPEGNIFLTTEFLSKKRYDITLNESSCLARASKVKESVSKYADRFASTDYDYVLDLTKLGVRYKILFDLTTGLWRKGLGKTKTEFVEQWLHNLVEVPRKNRQVLAIWHYGLDSFKTYEGMEIGRFLIEKARLRNNEYMYVQPNSPLRIPEGLKTVFIPLYSDNPEYYNFREELNALTPEFGKSDIRSTVLYKTLKEVIVRILEPGYSS